MNKRNKCFFIVLLMLIAGVSAFLNRGVLVSDIILLNVDALARGEAFNKYSEKETTQWDEGPYFDIQGRKYYVVNEVTNCYGEGLIDCYFDYNCSVKYL